MARKKAGDTRGRTEVVTIRLTPRIRRAVFLAANIQRRTTSNFVECAVVDALVNGLSELKKIKMADQEMMNELTAIVKADEV